MKKSRLGQNFLFDKAILSRMISAAELKPEDTVVEIGPGPGALTRMLSQKVKKVVAIELDKSLYERLRADLAGYMNVEIVLADALTFPFESVGQFTVVANIPYYITTPIIFRLLEARRNLKAMTLTIQKEVADRVIAKPGGKDYGVLSIMVQYYSAPELKFIIPREAFRPVPKVDSAVVHIRILPEPFVHVKNEKILFKLVRTAFSQRRKTLGNSLKSFGGNIRNILISCGIDPLLRPERISLEEFAKISDLIAEDP